MQWHGVVGYAAGVFNVAASATLLRLVQRDASRVVPLHVVALQLAANVSWLVHSTAFEALAMKLASSCSAALQLATIALAWRRRGRAGARTEGRGVHSGGYSSSEDALPSFPPHPAAAAGAIAT
jgi:hypothetical protein